MSGTTKDGLIYVVGRRATPARIKAGWTGGPIQRRLRSLETACGERLELLGWAEASRASGLTEADLLRRLDRWRLLGEWCAAEAAIPALRYCGVSGPAATATLGGLLGG